MVWYDYLDNEERRTLTDCVRTLEIRLKWNENPWKDALLPASSKRLCNCYW